MVKRETVAIVAGKLSVLLIAELGRIKTALETDHNVLDVVVVRRDAVEEEVVLIRAVRAVFVAVVDTAGVNGFTVVAVEGFLVIVIVVIAAITAAKDVFEYLAHGILKRILKVLRNGFTKRRAGVAKDVAHHHKHDRVAGRARGAGRDVEHLAVAKVDLEGFVGAEIKPDTVHCRILFVVALTGESVRDGDVKLAFVEAKFFHRQTGEVDVVIGRADVRAVNGAAVVIDVGFTPLFENVGFGG